MEKYQVRCRENGQFFEDASSIKEAKTIIKNFEDDDRRNDAYEEDYYEVYDHEKQEVVF